MAIEMEMAMWVDTLETFFRLEMENARKIESNRFLKDIVSLFSFITTNAVSCISYDTFSVVVGCHQRPHEFVHVSSKSFGIPRN